MTGTVMKHWMIGVFFVSFFSVAVPQQEAAGGNLDQQIEAYWSPGADKPHTQRIITDMCDQFTANHSETRLIAVFTDAIKEGMDPAIIQTGFGAYWCLAGVAMGSAALMWYEAPMDDDGNDVMAMVDEAAFFEAPEQAVDAIRAMLREEDWVSLARYYDLEGSGVDRETLVSGEFFIRTERPEVSHPGGFWRYKHPFAPAFDYAFTTPAAEAGVVIVRVEIEIDQGAGQPAQRGWQEFSMRQSEKGFQILPNDAEAIDVAELLADPGPPSPGLPEG